jgi:hypothetical protein
VNRKAEFSSDDLLFKSLRVVHALCTPIAFYFVFGSALESNPPFTASPPQAQPNSRNCSHRILACPRQCSCRIVQSEGTRQNLT